MPSLDMSELGIVELGELMAAGEMTTLELRRQFKEETGSVDRKLDKNSSQTGSCDDGAGPDNFTNLPGSLSFTK